VSQNRFTILPNHDLVILVSAAVALHPNSFALKSQVSLPLPPLLRIKSHFYISNTKSVQWEYSSNLGGAYLDILHEIATSGTFFKDKNALLTGVGKGSIGVEIVKGLLAGGARVVITTSSYSRKTC
jgi:3-oxoacyl-ACP reductase-like protein